MNNTDFAKSSAYMRVQEKRLLTTAAFDRIIEVTDKQEVYRMLSQNSDYDFTQMTRSDEYEGMLKDELKRVYGECYKVAGAFRGIVDILAAKYDFHNMKTALKAKHFPQRTRCPYIHVTSLSCRLIEEYAQDMSAKTDLPSWALSAMSNADAAFVRTGNPQYIDIELDKSQLSHMLSLALSLDNGFITEYVRMLIDFYNTKAMLRVKEMGRDGAFLNEVLCPGGKNSPSFYSKNFGKPISGMGQVFMYKYFGDAVTAGIELFEKTGSFSGLERLLDNFAVEYTKKVKLKSFGPELLFAYILSKENEIRQIRILVTCKENSVPGDEIRERLRDNYA